MTGDGSRSAAGSARAAMRRLAAGILPIVVVMRMRGVLVAIRMVWRMMMPKDHALGRGHGRQTLKGNGEREQHQYEHAQT